MLCLNKMQFRTQNLNDYYRFGDDKFDHILLIWPEFIALYPLSAHAFTT